MDIEIGGFLFRQRSISSYNGGQHTYYACRRCGAMVEWANVHVEWHIRIGDGNA